MSTSVDSRPPDDHFNPSQQLPKQQGHLQNVSVAIEKLSPDEKDNLAHLLILMGKMEPLQESHFEGKISFYQAHQNKISRLMNRALAKFNTPAYENTGADEALKDIKDRLEQHSIPILEAKVTHRMDKAVQDRNIEEAREILLGLQPFYEDLKKQEKEAAEKEAKFRSNKDKEPFKTQLRELYIEVAKAFLPFALLFTKLEEKAKSIDPRVIEPGSALSNMHDSAKAYIGICKRLNISS